MSAIIKAAAALAGASYLDAAPSDEQRDAWREMAANARAECDAQLAENERLKSVVKPLSDRPKTEGPQEEAYLDAMELDEMRAYYWQMNAHILHLEAEVERLKSPEVVMAEFGELCKRERVREVLWWDGHVKAEVSSFDEDDDGCALHATGTTILDAYQKLKEARDGK